MCQRTLKGGSRSRTGEPREWVRCGMRPKWGQEAVGAAASSFDGLRSSARVLGLRLAALLAPTTAPLPGPFDSPLAAPAVVEPVELEPLESVPLESVPLESVPLESELLES